MTAFEVKVAGAIDDVDREAWDRLAREFTFYSSSAWLSSVEASELPRHEPAYHQVWDGDRLVGALPSYWVLEETSGPYTLEVIGSGHWLGRKVLIGGNRRAYLSEWPIDPALTGAERSEVIRMLAESLLARAAEVGADTVVLPFLTHQAMLALRREGLIGTPFLGTADAAIPLPGRSFDDYLAQLSSALRRRARREIRRFEAAGFTVGTEHLDRCADEVGQLYGNLERKYGGDDPNAPWLAVIRDQAVHMAKESLIFTARQDGRMVGFAVSFEWGRRLFMRYAGFDYDTTADTRAYFNLSYYLPVRYAYEHQYAEVHLGLQSLDAKTSRGAVLSPIWTAELTAGPDRDDRDVTAEARDARAHNVALLEDVRATPGIREEAFDAEAFDLDVWSP
jgi:predicted N-acyltransferase